MNNLPPVKCNLYHPFSWWCRKACRCLREILTFKDQRSRCVNLVIGQCQKAPYFSAFHWLPHGCLITIGQHFVTTRVVHLPKRAKTSLITESDQSKAIHQLCMIRTAWSNLDQAVRVVHSCKSWLQTFIRSKENPISSVNLSVNTGICRYR